MPLFQRSSFQPPRKPPRRKSMPASMSLPNISGLDETTYSLESTRLGAEGAPVTMRLGGHEISFEDGQWIVAGGGGAPGSREYIRLQKQTQKLVEENNLLKYKVELLLDMLAASNADCLVMQRELEAMKKVQNQTPKKR